MQVFLCLRAFNSVIFRQIWPKIKYITHLFKKDQINSNQEKGDIDFGTFKRS